MKSKFFGLFMTLMLLLSGNGFAQSLPLLLTDDSFWNGGGDNFYYSGGSSSLETCDPDNPVNGCVKESKQSTGSFLTGGDIEIRKLVQPTAETGVFDVSIGVRGKEVVPNEPICAVVVFDRSSTMAGTDKFENARAGAVELLNLLHSQNPENYLGFVSFHLSADAEIQLEKRDSGDAFSTGEIRNWSTNDEGTNIHWGLVEARNQLMGQGGCEDLRKFVILISDGEPNSYYTLSGDECYTNNGTGAGWGGSNYPVCLDLISGDPFAAKYATGVAALLKENDYSTIYSIGYGANTNGKAILREIASDSNDYRDGNSSSIIQIFNSIAGDIASDTVEVGTDAQILDTLNQVVLSAGSNAGPVWPKITTGWQTFNFQVSLNPSAGTDWYKTNNGLTLSYTDAYDHSQTLSIAPNDTAEIYWKVPNVTVTFNPNGGTPTPDPVPVTPGGLIPPDDYPVDPELTGYHLTGWTITCGGNDFFNFATDVVTEDITLCAKWEPNIYQVKFDKNGGNGTMGNQTFTYNVSGNLNQNSYTKQGAIFNGWNTKQGGNGTSYKDKQEVRNLATTGTITLYAQWLDNEVTVTFDPNGGTPTPDPKIVDSGDTVPEPENPVLTGYHLTGWTRTCNGDDFFNFASDVVTGDITLCAKWEPNAYQIKFNGNGGNGNMPNQTLTYGTPENLNSNTFTKEGSTFVGWNTKADNSGSGYADQEQVLNLATTGVVNLYAQWSTNSYEIAFDKNTGNGTMTNQTLSYGTTGTLKTNAFTKTGYHFTRWNTKADGMGTPYQDRAQVRNLATTGVVRLYAQWSPNTYTIVYSGNGSTSGDMPNQSLTYDTTGSLNPNDFGKKGYKFKGWNTKPDGTGTPYQEKAQVRNLATTGEVMLYAQWEPNKYTIIFDGNGAKSGVMSGLEVEYDKDVTLTKNAYKKGSNTFLGWNTRADGKGTSYSDEQVVRNLATEGEIVLYAQWKSGGSSGGGGGGSKTYVCLNLPSNAVENNSLKPSGKNVDYYYSTDKSVPCTFLCKNGYVWDENAKKCVVVPPDDDPTPILPPDPECSIEGSTHSAEVNEAYVWACERGIIKSKTITGAKLGEFLNRAEMAKITTIFEMLEVGSMPDRTKDCSAFEASMSGYNSEMKNYMVTSCQLLRMGIHTADYTPIPDFMPRKFVSRAEFGTILSRILWGDKYEAEKNSRYYYVDHLYKLRDEGILTNIDPTLVERRSYAILMIYRAAKMLGKI